MESKPPRQILVVVITIRRSLDTELAATLVHSFVASRTDYYNAVLAGAPKATTNQGRINHSAIYVMS